MKLSKTMMINEKLLPTNKKAFTLAEVLITLSILGVVAALTIPTLVNRQSDLAAQVRLKKAISSYEDAMSIYMAETGGSDAAGIFTDANCAGASDYFKIVTQNGCTFTTADGVQWNFDAPAFNNNVAQPYDAKVYVTDAETSPRYGVTMYTHNGQVNGLGNTDGVANDPGDHYCTATEPLHGVFVASGQNGFLNDAFKNGDGAQAAACP